MFCSNTTTGEDGIYLAVFNDLQWKEIYGKNQNCEGMGEKGRAVSVGDGQLTFRLRDVMRAYYWYLAAFYCPDKNTSLTASELKLDVHWVDIGSGEVPYNLSGLLLLQIVMASICGLISIMMIFFKKLNIFKLFPLEIVFYL